MVRERLADAPAAAIAREALAGEGDVWIVGGAVRDALLDRPVTDFDLAVRGHVADAARTLARAADAHPFELSGERGMWRVQCPRRHLARRHRRTARRHDRGRPRRP